MMPLRQNFDNMMNLADRLQHSLFLGIRRSSGPLSGSRHGLLAKVFELLKAPNRTRFEYPDSGHDFPPETRENAYRWLEEQL